MAPYKKDNEIITQLRIINQRIDGWPMNL